MSIQGILLSKASSEGFDSVTGAAVELQKLGDKLSNSNMSAEKKTSYLVQYLLNLREPLLNLALKILISVLIVVIGRKIIKILLHLIDKWMDRSHAELGVQKFIHSLAKLVFNILLVFIVAGYLGVGTSSIVAIIGSAGLAIGLALQGSLSNFAGGVLILVMKPFRVGDYIITPSGEGTVTSIDIIYTRLLTTDNKNIVIPNGTISNSSITNTSAQDYRMMILDFTIPYQMDVEQVRNALLAKLQEESLLCQEKPMAVVIQKLTPVNVKLQAKAWATTELYWDAQYKVLELIKKTLKEQEVTK